MKMRVRFSALLVASSFALVGCGGSDTSEESGDISDKSPAKIIAGSKKQVASEDFVSVKGSGSGGGTELTVDLGFANDTASGTITVQGLTLEVLKADGKAFFKASDDFYRSTAGDSAEQVIGLIAGRWVVADPDDENFGDIASFTSKKDFFNQLLDPDGKLTKVDGKKINGVECVGLKSATSTLYFAKKSGLPVSLVPDTEGAGTLDFTYDEIDEAQAPAADQTVDLAELTP